jgi:hypothetical protein
VYQAYLAASSYYIWAFLVLLTVIHQLNGVGEKVWIKIWTSAYPTPLNAPNEYMLQSFGTKANEFSLLTDLPSSPYLHSTGWRTTRLPSAADEPFFYIGVYAAIGMFGILLRLVSVALQYVGALRASRILFQWVYFENGLPQFFLRPPLSRRLLVTVVRATFRYVG